MPKSFEDGPRHYEVAGKGIFEVYFPKTRLTECINMRWLKLVRAKPKLKQLTYYEELTSLR